MSPRSKASYRPPEMAGPSELRARATEDRAASDDVMRQPGTMAALFLAVALLASAGVLVYALYGPSPETVEMSSVFTGGTGE